MIDRKSLSKRALALQDGLARSIDFLEYQAPGMVQRLGQRLHQTTDNYHLTRKRRSFGLGSTLALLGVAAVAAVVFAPALKTRLGA